MTSHEIALTLMADRRRRHYCLTHYTPVDWWECDVAEFTDAGYFKEYEIKMSRMDFFRDKEKASRGAKKHELLANGNLRGPNSFDFIVPKGLIHLDEVPEWAGLIEAEPRDRSHTIPFRISLRRVKDGRRLHDDKISDKVLKHSRTVAYYRMHDLMIDLARLTAKKSPDKEPTEPQFTAPTALTEPNEYQETDRGSDRAPEKSGTL